MRVCVRSDISISRFYEDMNRERFARSSPGSPCLHVGERARYSNGLRPRKLRNQCSPRATVSLGKALTILEEN
jgi:hypothetical protein